MAILSNTLGSNWVKSQSNTAEEELKKRQKQLVEILGYELNIALVFNDKKNLAFRKSIYTKNKDYLENPVPSTIFINRPTYSGVKNTILGKDLVERYSRYGDSIMVDGMASEVFIPLFDCDGSNMVMVGCLYLGSTQHKELTAYDLAASFQINSIIGSIAKLSALVSNQLEQKSNMMNMVNVFLDILSHKENFLPNHSFNVANWSKSIGIELGFNKEELDKIYLAGLLHDSGKAMVDYNILNKSQKLTEEEFEIVKKHSVDGATIAKYILGDIYEFRDIPKVIRHHHERYNGKGYPDSLKEDEIPFYSYIIGIADAVDAMLSNRPYQKGLSISKTIDQLYSNKGTQFHPQLVDIMVKKLVQAQNQLKETVEESINLSTLIINFKDQVHIIEGALIKYGDCYQFRPMEEVGSENFDLISATDIELVVKNINTVNHYEVRLEEFCENCFYISSLKLIPTINTFNLLWNLEGVLYLTHPHREVGIEIVRIGGNTLTFSLYREGAIEIPKGHPLVLKVVFEEGTVDITGSVMRIYDMGAYKYFDYFYTEIPDSKRDFIYRQLFRKQIELRQAMAKYR